MALPRAKLLELRVSLGAAIRGAEPWEESYKLDRPTFRRLVEQEQLLERDVAEHYDNLAQQRLSNFIRWGDVLPRLQADVVVPGNDPATSDEERLLIQVVLPHIEELALIGASAGEALTGFPADTADLRNVLLDNARKSTAELVSAVTDTTRDIIRRTIQSSIARGDNLAQMTERLKEVVGNPVRAKMIAQTETVNAYQSGLEQFAIESGAVSREWEAKIGACKLCAPLDGKVLPMGELFTLSNGRQVSRPAAHVRCRCALIYNYPD